MAAGSNNVGGGIAGQPRVGGRVSPYAVLVTEFSGVAGGDLQGAYPNPTIKNGVVTDAKIVSVAWTKVTAAPSSFPPGGPASGDLTGTYPGPQLAATGVTAGTYEKVTVDAKGRVLSGSPLAASDLPVLVGDSGAGGVQGAAPAPAAGDASAGKFLKANGAWEVPPPASSATPTGPAGGALTGTYPDPTLADGVVDTGQLVAGAVTDAKIASVSFSKVTGAPSSYPPNGAAGGDLTGSYPAPSIAPLAVNNSKINDVSWTKVTGAPSSFPPTGAAGGDLTGTYPNPALGATGVTTGVYGLAAAIPQLTIDAKGRATTAANVPVAIPLAQVTDVTISASNLNQLDDGVSNSLHFHDSDRARANHTGTQTASTISDFSAAADARITAQKGFANGLATLDGAGKLPASQLPVDVMEYKGVWSAATNIPHLQDGTGDTGDFYKVTTAGTVDFGSGPITFSVGDSIIYSGTVWQRVGSDDAVTSVNGQIGAVVISALPPNGPASGDLTGTYPAPTIAANAVTASKINNLAVTDAKINDVSWTKVTGAPSSFPPTGAASGDLTGTYPSPTIAANAVSTTKIANLAVTDAKINDVSWTKVTGAPSSFPPNGAAGGDLAGSTYPNPTIAPNAITSGKIAALAVTDAKINDVAFTKITGAPTSYPPNGSAGGDLTGTYPNPTIANLAVTDAKILSVLWTKVTGAPSSFPPSGSAGGDLTGTYPNPTIAAGAITDAKVNATANIAWTKLANIATPTEDYRPVVGGETLQTVFNKILYSATMHYQAINISVTIPNGMVWIRWITQITDGAKLTLAGNAGLKLL